MEIDDINLQDELTSGFLVKYLNGEIPFHKWLQLQSGANTEENVGEEMVAHELCGVDMVDDNYKTVHPDDDGVLIYIYNYIYTYNIVIVHSKIFSRHRSLPVCF